MTWRAAAVLLDLDGTIVDSRRTMPASMAAALVDRGLEPVPLVSMERFIGPSAHDAFTTMAAEQGHEPTPDLIADLVRAYRRHYQVISIDQARSFPGLPEALGRLTAAGHTLAVATSKPLTYTLPILDTLGLTPRFAVIEGPASDAERETKAATVRRALTALGRPTGAPAAVMVGDRSQDVEGGKANGLATVGVLWGIGTSKELTGAGADALAAAPGDLPAAVARAGAPA